MSGNKRLSGSQDAKFRRIRDKKAIEQNWLCYYCDTYMEMSIGPSYKLYTMTGEHVIPLSQGGANDETNIVAVCSQCNYERSKDYKNRYLRK